MKAESRIPVSYTQAIDIYGIEYGIEDYVLYRWVTVTSEHVVHNSKLLRSRVRYTPKGHAYFNSYGSRYPLAHAMKLN